MNTKFENTQQQLRSVHWLIILTGVLMMQPLYADEAPFDAYETVREAGIGTNAPDYYKHSDANASQQRYVAPTTPKSETIYLNGKAVCFKLESDVSVAYYCN